MIVHKFYSSERAQEIWLVPDGPYRFPKCLLASVQEVSNGN